MAFVRLVERFCYGAHDKSLRLTDPLRMESVDILVEYAAHNTKILKILKSKITALVVALKSTISFISTANMIIHN